MSCKRGADYDYLTGPTIDALAQKVLAERPCLTFTRIEATDGRLFAPRKHAGRAAVLSNTHPSTAFLQACRV